MRGKENIDPTLRALGGRALYQWLQVLVINVGAFGAAYQLLDNIFIGREVEGHWCSAPDNSTTVPTHVQDVLSTDSHVIYGECAISVFKGNLSASSHDFPCIFGYDYDYRRELSFRTEFDLVCDRKMLGGFAQSFVIMGQGVGAVLSSIVSDRFGRKRVLVGSQVGLLVVGLAIGLAPSYPVLGILKFIAGCFQQGVVGTMAAMSIELFPKEFRSMQPLVFSVLWGLGASSMALFAYTMRDLSWRYLQFTLSSLSLLIVVLQLWYLDESLRWLVTNGKKRAALRVMERAARVNGKQLSVVLKTLQESEAEELTEDVKSVTRSSSEPEGNEESSSLSSDAVLEAMHETLEKKQAEKLTILDIFRHRVLLPTALVIWLGWFACAISFFTLYMMSTTLVGSRYLNYFLTALMEVPPGFLLYVLVDRKGRKPTARVFYTLAGIGLLGGGVLRIFTEKRSLATLSVVMAMLGMVGASGLFGIVFFVTPELFPTNMRNQAVGVSSFAGRFGGMLAPFMTDLAEVAVWAPGAMIGILCFVVVFLFRYVPETKGRELPHTIEDIKDWHSQREKDLTAQADRC